MAVLCESFRSQGNHFQNYFLAAILEFKMVKPLGSSILEKIKTHNAILCNIWHSAGCEHFAKILLHIHPTGLSGTLLRHGLRDARDWQSVYIDCGEAAWLCGWQAVAAASQPAVCT